MSSYEILVFEGRSLYDTAHTSSETEAIRQYIQMCRRYVSPEYNPKEEVSLEKTNMAIFYTDCHGTDKPMMVQLIGVITDELYKTIQEKLKRFYIHNCEDCGDEISLERVVCIHNYEDCGDEISLERVVCDECANK